MRDPGFDAIELPYLGGQLAMLLIVPVRGQFADFTSSFDWRRLESIVEQLTPRVLQVSVPRFQFSTDGTLDDALSDLGMGVAFDADAGDFGRITGDERLTISDVSHATYVSVDEEGSDGDAVTVVPPVGEATTTASSIVVDRPFLFVVRDRTTGLVIQIGRVVEPQS
jgi:serpin B